MNLFPWPTVSAGETSDRVRTIQYLLRARGHAVVVDGVFGTATTQAVKAVQSGAGLAQDGVIGPKTWPALVVTISLGSAGDAVRALQVGGLLTPPWVDALVLDGAFGPATEERVRGLQHNWGLTQDAVVGPETWSFVTASTKKTWPLVKVGATDATNWRVSPVQHLLRAHGATIVADGTYGPLSGEAMRQFQLTLRSTEISTTCGQWDWPALIITTRLGDTGEAVRAVQCYFLDLVVDGVFGPATDAKVRDFQNQFLPTTDGIVGPQTWHAFMVPSYG